ncbi:MAG TPA: hypothetical protein VN328_04605 [Thermodesulfovibrionales bacterium]|nr:hypothetical protein [Thermodesulfovibrionales bacterium]
MKTATRLLLVAVFVLLSAVAYADEKRYSLPIDDSPVYGPEDAPITIIEFLDFQ